MDNDVPEQGRPETKPPSAITRYPFSRCFGPFGCCFLMARSDFGPSWLQDASNKNLSFH